MDDDFLLDIAQLFVEIVVTAAVEYVGPLYDKTPYHTSSLSGEAWVAELLDGHPDRIRCELGVSKGVFAALINVMQEDGMGSSRHVMLEEKVAIFLYTCVTGLSLRHVGERFQRAGYTISKYIYY